MGFISDSISATTISANTLYITSVGSGTPQISLGLDSNFQVVTGSSDNNIYTTGTTISGNVVEFNRTDTQNAYDVNLSGITYTNIITSPTQIATNVDTANDYLGITGSAVLTDEASNYGGIWNNGSNQGTGFNPWAIIAQPNTGGFIGNPALDGMGTAGIGTTAFGLFCNSTPNSVNVSRPFTSPLEVGDVFSFYWAVNFDGAPNGNKGFDLKAGGSLIFNADIAASSSILSNLPLPYNVIDSGYGTTPMLVTLTRTTNTQYTITITSRSGGPTYSAPINSSLGIDEVNFYNVEQPDGLGQRNLYFNKLEIKKLGLNKVSVDELKIALNVGTGLYSAGTGTDSTVRINTSNFANGNCSIVASGSGNTATGQYSIISGGLSNKTEGCLNTIAGGCFNTTQNFYSTVSGGRCNTASGYQTIIAGGVQNTAFGASSNINGGIQNKTIGGHSTIGGGILNIANGLYSVISGGYHNTTSNQYSTISGGRCNTVAGFSSSIGGGCENKVSLNFSTIGGGEKNTVSCYRSTIGGGYFNTTSGNYATIGGGYLNTASGCYSFIGSGNQNNVGTIINTISGYGPITYNGTISGTYNVSPSSQSSGSGTGASFQIDLFSGTVSGYYSPTYAGSTVSGYYGPFAPTSAGIPGGSGAQFSFNFSPPGTLSNVYINVGGQDYTNGDTLTFDGTLFGGSPGTDNVTIGISTSSYATVSSYYGGQNYQSGANLTFLGSLFGGSDITDDVVINNIATSSNGKMAVVIGGAFNTSSEYASTIGGGFGNRSLGLQSTISGGYCNLACGPGSTISGGHLNTTNGGCSSILGGRQNTTLHDCSFIIGSGICTTAANTTHMNCLNLKNIPVNPGPGTLPSGTVYRCSATGNILHICI